ncbi:MAG: ABC transporter substrate-binding protein, partial [Alphaproteobacteria bacterium]|nr:ABC transporter substrate-binding protein [Alphaproteobacteria bacterium]
VGMAAANFGDDDGDGLLPWVAERLKELDAQAPQLFDEGDGIDFEAVAGTRPDVILAAYSGLSQSDYDTLSQIAPVIAYPQAPWSTDWREMIRFDSAGLGLAPEGETLIADIERKIAMEVAKYPELRGKTAMFVTHLDANDLSIVNFYTTQDTRVRFFGDLGLSTPKSVVQASSTGSFAGSISAEQIDLFDDVDILVTYGDRELIEAMKANPLLAHMPAVKHDAIVMLGRDPVGTAANPTPLSITWVLPAYVAMLAEAARKTE